MLLDVSIATAVSMCMLSLTPSINIAYAQSTANNTSATTGISSSADKTGTITNVQNDPAGTWKLSYLLCSFDANLWSTCEW